MSKVFKASEAKNNFGRVLDSAQSGPVRISKNGRDVAVVLSVDAFEDLARSATSARVNPAVRALHERSADRWAAVYRALAR